jgi:putative transposase
MIRTYKYRLYPHARQAQKLVTLLDLSRKVYNAALEQRRDVYEETGTGVTYTHQSQHFGEVRRNDPDGLGLLNFSCMQHTLRKLDKAFRSFFRRVKAGETPGYPRFKGRNRFESFEFTHGDGCQLRFDDNQRALLYVQNVGEIKIKYHRPIPDGAQIKHVVVKRSLGKWYVCFQLELPEVQIVQRETSEIGIDVGLHSLLALSDGALVENPRWLRVSLAELRVKQRRLARRKKGSHRRRTAAFQVAKQHAHIANQRRDFWHKVTRELAETHTLIAIEELNLSFMTHNHHIALSAHDAGLGLFRQLLESKAEEAGSQVVVVPPQYTSQRCSGCGKIVRKDLSIRTHHCPHCDLVLDRDVNAAVNILHLARTGPSGHNVGGCNAERVPRSSPL